MPETVERDVLEELRRAAARRRELADAYSRKAEKLRHEATEMRQVASRLARRSSQRTDQNPDR